MNFRDTREKLIVLDKNFLRATAANEAKQKADSSNFGVIVIDTTFKEIARGGNWPDHYVNDFRDWTDRPDRMSISRPVGELLREEQGTGRTASIVDIPLTTRHRQLQREILVGNRASLVQVSSIVTTELARLTAGGGELNAAERTTLMRNLLNVWWNHGNAATREHFQREFQDPACGPLVEIARYTMGPTVRAILKQSLESNGYSPANSDALLNGPSFTNFIHSGFVAYSLVLWAQGRHLDAGTNDQKFLNQMLDLDYVAYGLCCEALMTNEVIMRRLEGGLRIACDSIWPSKTIDEKRREWAYFSWLNRQKPQNDDWADWFAAEHAIK